MVDVNRWRGQGSGPYDRQRPRPAVPAVVDLVDALPGQVLQASNALASPTLLGSRRRSWSNCPGIILGPGLNQKNRTGGCGLGMDPVVLGCLRGRVHLLAGSVCAVCMGCESTHERLGQAGIAWPEDVRAVDRRRRPRGSQLWLLQPRLAGAVTGILPRIWATLPGRDGDGMLQSVAARPISGRRGSPAKLVERVAGQFGLLQSKLREDKLGRDSPAEGGGCQQLHGAQSRETLLRLSRPTAWK